MIHIPYKQLSEQALAGVIDAFILREGTDYGHRDIPIAEKRERVLTLLQSDRAAICFYPESDYFDIEMIS